MTAPTCPLQVHLPSEAVALNFCTSCAEQEAIASLCAPGVSSELVPTPKHNPNVAQAPQPLPPVSACEPHPYEPLTCIDPGPFNLACFFNCVVMAAGRMCFQPRPGTNLQVTGEDPEELVINRQRIIPVKHRRATWVHERASDMRAAFADWFGSSNVTTSRAWQAALPMLQDDLHSVFKARQRSRIAGGVDPRPDLCTHSQALEFCITAMPGARERMLHRGDGGVDEVVVNHEDQQCIAALMLHNASLPLSIGSWEVQLLSTLLQACFLPWQIRSVQVMPMVVQHWHAAEHLPSSLQGCVAQGCAYGTTPVYVVASREHQHWRIIKVHPSARLAMRFAGSASSAGHAMPGIPRAGGQDTTANRCVHDLVSVFCRQVHAVLTCA